MLKLAVFVSGGGSNLQNIIDSIASGRLAQVKIARVIASKENTKAEDRARKDGIPVSILPANDPIQLQEILQLLAADEIDLIVLAGYLQKISPELIRAYPGKIINIHPALLPKYGGKGMYGIKPHQAVLKEKDQESGATVHLVNEEYDKGKILLQKTVMVKADDSPETLQQRVMEEAEKVILPAAIAKFAQEKEQNKLKENLARGEDIMKRALISVSDKAGVDAFARQLQDLGYEIISTGGTASFLKEEGIEVIAVENITGFPECLDGRVKTLHPRIFGGILARRDLPTHQKEMKEQDIKGIDLIVVNLYPFLKTIQQKDKSIQDCIEQIDIGGPSLLRAAAKNYQDVTVICEPIDYEVVLEQLKDKGSTDMNLRYKLALKVFEHTAHYDAVIADWLREKAREDLPAGKYFTPAYTHLAKLRYGENPQQSADYYQSSIALPGSLTKAVQLNGKELSYNNIADTDAALSLLREFDLACVVAVKHANPCGVGIGLDLEQAWLKAYDSDPVSIFGGIVAVNREVETELAEKMSMIFLEVIVAPSFSQSALAILKEKENLRLLELPDLASGCPRQMVKNIYGGLLVQDEDSAFDLDWQTPTNTKAHESQMADLIFAIKVVKHVKSNAIVLVKDGATIGIGAGQMNRVQSARIAIAQAGDKAKGSVLGSDAFFPFPDTVTEAYKAGVSAIIQPGGSLKDQDSIDLCNDYNLPMVFTGKRHFRH